MAKPLIAFRVNPGSLEWFDALATEYDLSRAHVFRAAMLVAREHPEELAKMLTKMKEFG